MKNDWKKELMKRLELLYISAERNMRMFPEHDLNHAIRVMNLCLYINKKDSLYLDKDILIAAAMLHDVGYISDDSPKHAESSIQFAKVLLPEVKFPRHKITPVILCIKHHDFVPGRKGWEQKVPMECHILRDADAIESFGCLGLIRYASWGGRNQMPFIIQYKKSDDKSNAFPQIDLIKNINIRSAELIMRCYTKTGMKIIRERFKIMQKFILEIEKEINFAKNLGGE